MGCARTVQPAGATFLREFPAYGCRICNLVLKTTLLTAHPLRRKLCTGSFLGKSHFPIVCEPRPEGLRRALRKCLEVGRHVPRHSQEYRQGNSYDGLDFGSNVVAVRDGPVEISLFVFHDILCLQSNTVT